MIVYSDIFVMWGLALLFLLWRTNSLKTSITTTAMVIGILATGIMHKFGFFIIGLITTMSILSVLVWRVIPHDSVDRWSKDV